MASSLLPIPFGAGMRAFHRTFSLDLRRAVVGAGLKIAVCCSSVSAQPIPLPYRSQAPFIPTLELFGGPNKGLILGAEDVDRGRPAPVTIGNTTFVPQVRRAGELYGGYTRVDGDLQVIRGDLYLGDQAVGEALQQQGATLQQQGSSINQLQEASTVQNATLQQHRSNLDSLNTGAAQAQQAIQQLNQSVGTLDQATQQQSATLQQQGSSINQLQEASTVQNATLQQHRSNLDSLNTGAAQAQQAIQQLNQSVGTLDQATQQQSATLQQHATVMGQQSASLLQQGAAIDGLSAEMTGVKQSIAVLDQNLNNLGNGVAGATALASALASLPVDSVQSPLSCGVGSGGYSDRYALAMGCAVNLASSLSLNAGGAYLFGGASSYGGGSLSDVAGRFGVSYRFGVRDGGALGTARSQRKLENELRAIKEENRALQTVLVALQKRVDLLHASASQP